MKGAIANKINYGQAGKKEEAEDSRNKSTGGGGGYFLDHLLTSAAIQPKKL